MAKKESAQNNENLPRIIPESFKETLLVRYPENGSVKVVSDLKKEKDKCKIATVEAAHANRPAYYIRQDSRFIADFIQNTRLQADDLAKCPEFYIVPFGKVKEVTENMLKLQADPQDIDGLKAMRQYRAYPSELEKIRFDLPELEKPLTEAKMLGIDVDRMFTDPADTTIRDLQRGIDSKQLFEVHVPFSEHSSLTGNYSIHPSRDKNGEVRFDYQAALPRPEFEINEDLKMELSTEEKEELRMGKTLGRPIKNEGEYCLAAMNKNTLRMVYVPMKEVKAPDFINYSRLSEEQKKEYQRGNKIRLENCHYSNDASNTFSCNAQFNVQRMDYMLSGHVYAKPYIPKVIKDQLTPEMHTKLLAGEEIDGRSLKSREGKPYTCNLRINPSTNNTEFVRSNRIQEDKAVVISTADEYYETMRTGSRQGVSM